MSIAGEHSSTSGLQEKSTGSLLGRLLVVVENRQLVLLSIILFMIIAGARLLVINNFGSDIPLWDQWGAEATEFYKPYFEGTLKPGYFFSAHNEHRILFTRLLSLGLLLMNGLWDMRLQTVVNALIYSLVGTGLFWFVGRYLGRLQRVLWCLGTGLIFSLPYGWENSLWGFQSQFYLLVGVSFLVMYLSWAEISNPYKWGILLFLVQVSALFTMGSGVLAPLVILAVQLLALIRNRGEEADNRRVWLRVAITVLVVMAGFLIMEHVSVHDRYRAPSLAHLLKVFAHTASWPDIQSGIWWCINWLPFALFGLLFLLRRTADNPLTRFALSFGSWVLVQELATAYARNGLAFRSKYSDISALCLLVNLLAMIILSGCFSRVWKRGLVIFSLLWGATNLYHLGALTLEDLTNNLPRERYSHGLQLENSLMFLQTGDPALLIGKNRWEIPHTNPEAYAMLLRDPFVLSILPRSINYSAVVSGRPRALLSTAAAALAGASLPLLYSGLLLLTVTIVCTIIYHFSGRGVHDQEDAGKRFIGPDRV